MLSTSSCCAPNMASSRFRLAKRPGSLSRAPPPKGIRRPFNNIGPMELISVLVIALVVIGPKRLPEVGKSLGHGMREFKDSLSGERKPEEDEEEAEVTTLKRA